MKMRAITEKILNATLMVERIVGKKESLPILSCILIDAQKELTLKSTNLEAGIEATMQADVSEKGTVAVPAAILSQTLRSLSGDQVSLSTDEGNLLIESRGSKTLIKAIPHAEFPALSARSSKKGISVTRENFMRGIQAVQYAASPSMIRPDLGSISISIARGSMVTVATDSFRLAEKTVPDIGNKSEIDFLIPLRHANELLHILERLPEEWIEIGTDEAQLTLSGGGIRYVSRVVDATFPNYKEIIPKNTATEATVLKSDFSEMLKKARVFSGNDQHVGLHVYPKKKIFTATARSNDIGEMSDSIDAALSGDDIDINFHIGYLADCLPSIESDSVTLSFAGPSKPLVIRGVSDASFMYLVMPLNR